MAWSNVLVFDLIVVMLTLAKTIKINRSSGGDRTLTHVLIRDGKTIVLKPPSIVLIELSRCHVLWVYLMFWVKVLEDDGSSCAE